jgi:hypothetical protein
LNVNLHAHHLADDRLIAPYRLLVEQNGEAVHDDIISANHFQAALKGYDLFPAALNQGA